MSDDDRAVLARRARDEGREALIGRYQAIYEAHLDGMWGLLAAETGVFAVVVDPRRLPKAFDATLGAFDIAEGFTVYVDPSGVPQLRARLAESLTVDPNDPLHSLTTAELLALAGASLDANLAEQVIAEKLLAGRGDEPLSSPDTAPAGKGIRNDPHLAADACRARWIGVLALIFPVTCLLIAAPTLSQLFRDPVNTAVGHAIFIQTALTHVPPVEDRFFTALRIFMGALIPVAASGALAFSRRKLRDGSSRPMFPQRWRRLGWTSLIFIIAVYLIPLAYVIWIMSTAPPGEIP